MITLHYENRLDFEIITAMEIKTAIAICPFMLTFVADSIK